MTINRLVLVGLMGSGKSSVGRLAARQLGWPYADGDDLVLEAQGANLEALRQSQGGAALHEAELTALRQALAQEPPFVVSAAASVVDTDAGRAMLKTPGVFVVWLRAAPAVLAERIGTSDPTSVAPSRTRWRC